jgi:succinate dehydrogenase/fumarate reductase flavoprotein subunit
MEALAQRIEQDGSQILLRTGLTGLRRGPDGSIAGVDAAGARGVVSVRAPTAVLATGGFQASPEMRARYLGRWADRVIVRSNPYSTGDGLEAARNIGAATAGPFSRFYGHMIPAPPASQTTPASSRPSASTRCF